MDVKIKICGITRLEDAQAAVDAGADALGFMFYEKSARHISPQVAAQIAGKIPSWIIKTGVFVNPTAEDVFSAVQNCGLNLLQFHGDETAEFCQTGFGVMTMKAFRIQDSASLEPLRNFPTDALLLDSFVAGKLGGTGEKFNWDLAVAAKEFDKPIFLAGGLSPENVADAVRLVRPFGVDVSSGVESSPGKKDARKIQNFVKAARGHS